MRRRLESGCATTGKDSASAPSGERLLHDEATALLLASAVAAWAILRRHDPGGGPAAAGYSLGVRRGMQITYGLEDLPTPDEMRAIAAAWAPYRSAGAWYMWRSLGVQLPENGR